jgi:DNA-directed RNA polymerase subunit H (RpoH/RPB5)
MSFLKSIFDSRNVLKQVLDIRGYKSSEIEDRTIEELDEIYDEASVANNVNEQFSFSISHTEIPHKKIHVKYYNLPKKGDSKSLRVTRSIINHIDTLYEEEDVNYEDDCIYIINEKLSDSIYDLLYKYNSNSQESYENDEIDDLNPAIQKFINKSDTMYNYRCIHNIHIIWLKILAFNPLSHKLVPKHRIIKNNKQIAEILAKCNCTKKDLPILFSYRDPIAIILGAMKGDLCEVIRVNKHSGLSYNYRICV